MLPSLAVALSRTRAPAARVVVFPSLEPLRTLPTVPCLPSPLQVSVHLSRGTESVCCLECHGLLLQRCRCSVPWSWSWLPTTIATPAIPPTTPCHCRSTPPPRCPPFPSSAQQYQTPNFRMQARLAVYTPLANRAARAVQQRRPRRLAQHCGKLAGAGDMSAPRGCCGRTPRRVRVTPDRLRSCLSMAASSPSRSPSGCRPATKPAHPLVHAPAVISWAFTRDYPVATVQADAWLVVV